MSRIAHIKTLTFLARRSPRTSSLDAGGPDPVEAFVNLSPSFIELENVVSSS